VIRIALLDEQELVRIGLRTVLERDGGVAVVADAGDCDRLASLVERTRPNIAILNIADRSLADNQAQTKGAWGYEVAHPASASAPEFEALFLLRDNYPDLRIVLMSATFNLDCLLHVLCGNASGYLLKNTEATELISAVHAVACGGAYIQSTLMEHFPRHLIKKAVTLYSTAQQAPTLSEREHGVLDLLVKGHTNREVSELLYLSPKTVEAYRARIYSKLGVRTRAGLFSCALDQGLVAF
jgi:two-component system response regulator NreC